MTLTIGFDDHQITDDLKAMDMNPAIGRDDVPIIALGKRDIIDDDQRMIRHA